MRQQLIRLMTVCGACATLGLQAQTSPGESPGSTTTPGSPGGAGQTTPGTPGSSYQRFSPTGRMGQHVRGSKVIGADVKSTQGESLGKIEDVMINPFSGRIDFAVLSTSSAGASSTTPATPGTSTSDTSKDSSSTTSSSGEKLIPVPWSFLRSSGMAGYASGSTTTPSSADQTTFTFSGDKSKLDNAPSFDRNNWPDVAQADWRQRIFSHFGMQPGSATGGAGAPGGSSTGESPTSPGNPIPPRSSTTPDSTTPQNK